MKTLCIYHANCIDGFLAATIVRRALGADNVEFYPGVYNKPPPDVTNRDVILVDFSYKNHVLRQMETAVKTLLIIDHHSSAEYELRHIPPAEDWPARQELAAAGMRLIDDVFDLNRSGAGLAWDYFFNCAPRPHVVDCVEDGDLYRFLFDDTREIMAALTVYPYDFEEWDKLLLLNSLKDFAPLHHNGALLLRKIDNDVADILAVTRRTMRIGGYLVPAANVPHIYRTTAGHVLCQDPEVPFGCCYYDTPNGRVFSLRSRKGDGMNVAKITEAYGGGGHVHAAGFTMPLGWEGDA